MLTVKKVNNLAVSLRTNCTYTREDVGGEVMVYLDLWPRDKSLALASSQPYKNKMDAITESAENLIFKLEEILINCRSEDPLVLTNVVVKFLNVELEIKTDSCDDTANENDTHYAYMSIESKKCYFSTPTNFQSLHLARVDVARQFIRDVMFLVHPHRSYSFYGLNLTGPVEQEMMGSINSGNPVIFTMRYCYHCNEATLRYMNEPNLTVVEVDKREDRFMVQQVLDQMGLVIPSVYANGVLQE